MYGTSTYGSGSYGGLIEQQPIVVFNPDVFQIGANIQEPVIFTEEITANLAIEVTLHQPTVTARNKSIIIKINTVDISNQVVFDSLSVSNNLYSEPNNAYFEIIKSSTKSYIPASNDEVEIIDTGVTIFKGLLIKISKSMEGFSERYNLEFKDWTEELSNTLVDQTYTNKTVLYIITDMFSTLPAYDLSNISDTTVISQLVSDNIPITNALDKLAEMTNKYWYVSPEKEIFFFAASDIPAPFGLTDINGKYDYSSLVYNEDLTQIRNLITIKGKGVAAVTVEDLTSQSTYGIKEYYERDDEILATSEATQKAEALLESFKDSIKQVTFRTLSEGLFAGQQITIQSTLRGINETLNIESMNFRATYQNRFYYEVKATSQRLGRIEDLFAKVQNTPDTTPAIQDQGSLQTVEFSAIDDETIQWSSGTIYTSDGTAYSISADASEVLTGDHIIYFDKSVSETVLQISTNFADGIGNGKIPLAYATKSAVATKGASIFPIGFGGRMQIDGGVHITDRSIIADNIAANAITANEIAASVITAGKIVTSLLTADNIQAGTLTGRTVIAKTGTSGVNIKLDSSAGAAVFLYDNTAIGSIASDSTASMLYSANANHLFFTGGIYRGQIDSNGMTLPAGKSLNFQSGRSLTDFGAYIYTDGAFRINGACYPDDNLSYTLGASDKQWSNGYIDNIFCDNVTADNDIYAGDNVSAQSFTDRTPYFSGNAISEIKKIKGKKVNGKDEIDHDSLPEFMKKTLLIRKTEVSSKNEIKETIREEIGRDLGAAISILLKAVTELDERISKIEN